jgi:hypothetical protein
MSQPMNPYDAPEYSRPGMSGTTKVLLGLGIGCGVCVLLCCGFFGAGTWLMVRTAQNALTKEPEAIRRLTAQIVDIEIPETLPPVAGMDIDVPVLGTKFLSWVAYGDANESNGLFLAQFGAAIANEENMQAQLRQSIRQSGQRDWDEIEIEQSEKHEVEINGESATFTVAKGRDRKHEEVWQVMGSFHGKGGPAMLVLKVKESEFTKEQVLAILDSMK